MVGSQVRMECQIAKGTPEATFGWDKNGYTIDNRQIIIHDSLLTLEMSNLTMEDTGVYTCIARNTVSYQNDHIELTVMQPKGKE